MNHIWYIYEHFVFRFKSNCIKLSSGAINSNKRVMCIKACSHVYWQSHNGLSSIFTWIIQKQWDIVFHSTHHECECWKYSKSINWIFFAFSLCYLFLFDIMFKRSSLSLAHSSLYDPHHECRKQFIFLSRNDILAMFCFILPNCQNAQEITIPFMLSYYLHRRTV